MRRLTVLLATLAVLGAVPSAAEDAVVTPCGDTTGQRVVEIGTSAKPVATPADPLYLSSTFEDLVLVLPEGEGAPTAADVTVTLGWSGPSDFDLTVTGPAGEDSSLATNAIEGNTESVTVSGVLQCEGIGVEVQNFAGLPTEALTLTVDVAA